MHKNFLIIGFLLAAIAVALGAFAAHGLKDVISERAFNTFETGVKYQFYHVIALLITGILYRDFDNKWIRYAGTLFISGIILFSGSLYIITYFIATVQPVVPLIGIITPFGGLAFIDGWLCLVTGIKKGR